MSFFTNTTNQASSSAPAQGNSIFGNTNPASTSTGNANTFGGLNPGAKPATGLFGGGTTPTTNPTGSLFGGGTTTPATGGGLFGGGPSNTSSSTNSNSLFGGGTTTANKANIPSGSLFGGGASASNQNSSTTSAFSFPKPGGADQGGAAPKPATPNFFNIPPANPSNNSTTPAAATTSAPSGGLFGVQPKPTENTSTPANGTSTSSGGLFGGGLFGKSPATSSTPGTAPGFSLGGLGGSKDNASKDNTTPTAPSGGLFGGGFATKPAEKKDSAPATTPGLSLFSATKDTPSDKKDPAASSSLEATSNDKPKDVAAPSTTPAPLTVAISPPSMLRGKTIEEIVNKWSGDLETHVREFNKFAGEVAVWDRALIENGNSLAALYSHVLAAEREQNDIDQSLDHIEQQQRDLASTLDSYEKSAQEILGGQGGSLRALDTGPADTERDKNYMLAADLHTNLDDLSGSLTQMIESVNALSLPSGTKDGAQAAGEDPMAQIAQILSSHLESLQWIDGAVREVEGKVSEVEKRVKESGASPSPSYNGKSRSFGLNQ